MIGGDAPYDQETGGGPADMSRPPHSQPLQFRQDPQSPQPPRPSQSRQPREGAAPAAPAEPAPAPASALAAPEPTGDERVDAALSRFAELATAPVADHVEVFEDVQRRLQDVLAAVDHEEPPETSAPEEPSDAASRPSPGPNPGPRPGPPNWGP
jgi:hypothetical protein